MRRLLDIRNIPTLAAFAVLVGLYVVCAILYPSFRDPWTARNVVAGASVLGLISIGMTFVIISGGIDLSVGAVIGFTGILVGVLVREGWHPVLAWSAALALGTLGGAGSGTIIQVFRLPPFIVTLGAMFFFRGVGLLISEQSVSIRHPLYTRLGAMGAGPVPPVVVILAIVAALAWVASRWTRFGRTTYAIGGSESSARLMGLPVASTKVRVYAVSGGCAALAGVASTLYTMAGNASAGQLAELDAIAAVVIGGAPLAGGAGSIPGTLAGVMITSVIQELITVAGVPNSWWSRIAIGALLLGFILLQRLVQARAERLTDPRGAHA